jgi:hypothetical protein
VVRRAVNGRGGERVCPPPRAVRAFILRPSRKRDGVVAVAASRGAVPSGPRDGGVPRCPQPRAGDVLCDPPTQPRAPAWGAFLSKITWREPVRAAGALAAVPRRAPREARGGAQQEGAQARQGARHAQQDRGVPAAHDDVTGKPHPREEKTGRNMMYDIRSAKYHSFLWAYHRGLKWPTLASSTMYTHVVHINPNIYVQEVLDQRKITAHGYIESGRILLIEHLSSIQIISPVGILAIRIMTDLAMFKSLYPRNTSISQDVEMASIEKHKYNAFYDGLGCTISMFNHSSLPNASCFRVKASCEQMFVVVHATETILPETEICISYCTDVSETHPYCDLARDKVPRISPPREMASLAKRIMDAYTCTTTFMGIVIRSHLSNVGFMFSESGNHVVYDEFRSRAIRLNLSQVELVHLEACNCLTKLNATCLKKDVLTLLMPCSQPTPVVVGVPRT